MNLSTGRSIENKWLFGVRVMWRQLLHQRLTVLFGLAVAQMLVLPPLIFSLLAWWRRKMIGG